MEGGGDPEKRETLSRLDGLRSAPKSCEEEETVIQKLLGLFLIDDLQRVRRKDQRKACRCYCLLLLTYVAAITQMTWSAFKARDNPPTSIALLETQEWGGPPPPNMVLCPTMRSIPTWMVGRYRKPVRDFAFEAQWEKPSGYRDAIQIMECNHYKDVCIFVKGMKPDLPLDGDRPTQDPSLNFRVGYTFGSENEQEQRPIGLGVGMWFTDATSPQQVCEWEDRKQPAFGGYTTVSAHMHGATPGLENGTQRVNWPYETVLIERTRRSDLHSNRGNPIKTHHSEKWRYATRVAPVSMLGQGYGHSWSLPLLTAAERQEVLRSCSLPPDAHADEGQVGDCLDGEAAARKARLDDAGTQAVYVHVQIWLSKWEVAATQTDPVNLLELLSQVSGAWGWVAAGFGIFFMKTYYDTYAACPCLRRSFWRRGEASTHTRGRGLARDYQRRQSQSSSLASSASSSVVKEEEGKAGDGQEATHPAHRRRSLSSGFKLASTPKLPTLNLGSVFLDWQDMHEDLRSMQEWYLQCRQSGRVIIPPPIAQPPEPDAEAEEEERVEQDQDDQGAAII